MGLAAFNRMRREKAKADRQVQSPAKEGAVSQAQAREAVKKVKAQRAKSQE